MSKKKFKETALEVLEKFPSAKLMCAIAMALLIAAVLYVVILFFLSSR